MPTTMRRRNRLRLAVVSTLAMLAATMGAATAPFAAADGPDRDRAQDRQSGASGHSDGNHGEGHDRDEGSGPVTLQLLNVSDFHGQLDPVRGVGGVEALSTYFSRERAANPNTITLAGGDSVGASAPLSGFFEDVPTIEAMKLMGFDVDTLGNHNFDAGLGRLQSQIDRAAPQLRYVSANLANVQQNLRGVAPYRIMKVGGVKVAVVGLTNPEAPGLVQPGSFGTMTVTDPVAAANRAREQAAEDGAEVFVAVIHAGITDPATSTGPLVDFARGVTGFDVVLGDHTGVQYSGTVGGALVSENKGKGGSYSVTTLTFDSDAERVTGKAVRFVTPTASAVPKDARLTSLLAPYRDKLAAAYDGKVAVTTQAFPGSERNKETAIGDLIADAMRARYGVQIALVNSGGIRQPLPSSYQPRDKTLRRPDAGYAAGPPYDLVTGDIYATLPFGNAAVTRTVTGSQLYAVLENGVSKVPGLDGRFPQVSGIRFTYDQAAPVGSRIRSVTLTDGRPVLRDATTYTFVTPDFVNAGGDGYTMLADGQGTSRELVAQVLLDDLKAKGTVTPATDGRIAPV